MSNVLFAHLLVVFVPAHHPGDAAEDGTFDRMVPGDMAGDGARQPIFETAAGLRFGH